MARRPTKKTKRDYEEFVAANPKGTASPPIPHAPANVRMPMVPTAHDLAGPVPAYEVEGEYVPSSFEDKFGMPLERVIEGLGPFVRRVAMDDSRDEIMIAWGRVAESRLGLSLVMEDEIRRAGPREQVRLRQVQMDAALGIWITPPEPGRRERTKPKGRRKRG